MLRKLEPYRVETNKNEPPHKFEMGMLNNASLASLEAALEYLLWLGKERGAEGGPHFKDRARRSLFKTVMTSVADYERGLSRFVLEEFLKLDGGKFRCFGITDPSLCEERDPTFAFEIVGLDPREIKQLLWDRAGIQIADGNHYSAAVVRHLGRDSLCRASFAHYDNLETAQAFVKAIGELIQ